MITSIFGASHPVAMSVVSQALSHVPGLLVSLWMIHLARKKIGHTEPMQWRELLGAMRSDIARALSRLY
jgi:hypothetical protein